MNVEGGRISVIPFPMQSPTRGELTTTSSLEVYWIALTDSETGSSPILSYNLQWDRNTDG
jgi:hypothetical protein